VYATIRSSTLCFVSDVSGGVLRYNDNLSSEYNMFTSTRPPPHGGGGGGGSLAGGLHSGEPLNLHKLSSSSSPGVAGVPQRSQDRGDRTHDRPSDRQVVAQISFLFTCGLASYNNIIILQLIICLLLYHTL